MYNMEKFLYWSFQTGQFFDVLEDEIGVLTAFQLRMKQRPPSSCKKCYGRFQIGKNLNTGLFIPCNKCKKFIDWETLHPDSDDNVMELLQ